jgi:hypothetical protein
MERTPCPARSRVASALVPIRMRSAGLQIAAATQKPTVQLVGMLEVPHAASCSLLEEKGGSEPAC